MKCLKWFIASPWRNKADVEQLSEALAKNGCEVYSFLQSGANLSTGASVADELKSFGEAMENWQSDPNIKRVFESEMEGLKNSEAVALIQPAGHSSLLEAGIAYGMGKTVVIIGPIEKPEVFYLLFRNFYPDIDAFLADLPNLEQ